MEYGLWRMEYVPEDPEVKVEHGISQSKTPSK